MKNNKQIVEELKNEFAEEDRTTSWIDTPSIKIENWLLNTLKEKDTTFKKQIREEIENVRWTTGCDFCRSSHEVLNDLLSSPLLADEEEV